MFIVEGQTESNFIKNIFLNYFDKNLFYYGIINLSGGTINIKTVVDWVKKLINSNDFVTTLIDFYKFQNPNQCSIEEMETKIKETLAEQVNNQTIKKFIPYLQKYEFEALLFADREIITKLLGLNKTQERMLYNKKYNTPEEINHSIPPSKVIKNIYPKFTKTIDAINIVDKIGKEKLMQECPKFASWIKTLELGF